MRLSASAAVQNGAFSDFLAAEIGEESNGMNLSLLSALTRQGVDPWQEAERLAGLQESKAVAALTAIITRALGSASHGDDTPDLAARILLLLPKPGQPPVSPAPRSTSDSANLLAGLTLPPPETLRWWAIALTIVLALVVSLWW